MGFFWAWIGYFEHEIQRWNLVLRGVGIFEVKKRKYNWVYYFVWLD
jgi:hypothetical protein